MNTGLLLTLFFLLGFSCQRNDSGKKPSDTISGIVIGIVDGDTYDILVDGNKTMRVRMEGIDAPERGMPYYRKSKKFLSELCFGKIVRLEIHEKDEHGRTIAFSFLEDGRELSHEMIKAGYAWHFTKYNSDKDLTALEKIAREAKIGLWADHSPMPPWVNRKLHRQGISTKDSFNIQAGQH